ncbi:MAG TPA: plastocyanin/azurin family copper-binding protein [Gemmatimonadales bacterium]|nr:plastocyanin/azurin family copper-binding protein [Gemmatimonadales bacterium]
MRWKLMGTIAALGALACGGGEQQQQQAQPAAGSVVEVRMTGNGTTTAAFEPATLTITPGTTVRFINVSGGPHNVAFWADSIPAGAADILNAAMPNRMDNLSGPFVTAPNETYDITFPANSPKGTYGAYCLPHLALGMKMKITVQ